MYANFHEAIPFFWTRFEILFMLVATCICHKNVQQGQGTFYMMYQQNDTSFVAQIGVVAIYSMTTAFFISVVKNRDAARIHAYNHQQKFRANYNSSHDGQQPQPQAFAWEPKCKPILCVPIDDEKRSSKTCQKEMSKFLESMMLSSTSLRQPSCVCCR